MSKDLHPRNNVPWDDYRYGDELEPTGTKSIILMITTSRALDMLFTFSCKCSLARKHYLYQRKLAGSMFRYTSAAS